MTIRKKNIGRLPLNLGDYDSTKAYGKKNRVFMYGCEWESKVENNTYAPAALNTVAGIITPDTTHWKLVCGSYDLWLVDNGYKNISSQHIDGVGQAGGIASLDNQGKVPAQQLPSYVDDVIELLDMTDTAPAECAEGDLYYNSTSKKIFTATDVDTWGETGADPERGKIYVNLTNNNSYRWGGTAMSPIANPDVYSKSEVDGLVATERSRAQGVEATKANASDVTALAGQIAGKASQSDLTTLSGRVDDNYSDISTQNSKIAQLEDVVQQAQMAIGAVPSDLVPTKDSTHWVTSGGVYNTLGKHFEIHDPFMLHIDTFGNTQGTTSPHTIYFVNRFAAPCDGIINEVTAAINGTGKFKFAIFSINNGVSTIRDTFDVEFTTASTGAQTIDVYSQRKRIYKGEYLGIYQNYYEISARLRFNYAASGNLDPHINVTTDDVHTVIEGGDAYMPLKYTIAQEEPMEQYLDDYLDVEYSEVTDVTAVNGYGISYYQIINNANAQYIKFNASNIKKLKVTAKANAGTYVMFCDSVNNATRVITNGHPVEFVYAGTTKIFDLNGEVNVVVIYTKNGNGIDISPYKIEANYMSGSAVADRRVSMFTLGTAETVMQNDSGNDYDAWLGYFKVLKVRDGLFYMYYSCAESTISADNQQKMGFAYSEDGVNWVRAIPDGIESPVADTNLIFEGATIGNGLIGADVFMVNDEDYPFRMVGSAFNNSGSTATEGTLEMWKSADGVNWVRMRVIAPHYYDNQVSCIVRGDIVKVYSRILSDPTGTSSTTKNTRWVSVLTCDINGNLICPATLLFGQSFYQASASILDQDRDIAFPTIIDTNNNNAEHIECYIIKGGKISKVDADMTPLYGSDEYSFYVQPGLVNIGGDLYLYTHNSNVTHGSHSSRTDRIKRVKVNFNTVGGSIV